MPEEILAKINYNLNVPAVFIDGVEVFAAREDVSGRPAYVQIMGAQVSPIQENDGSLTGIAVSKWVMAHDVARNLATRILEVLDGPSGEKTDGK